MRKNMLQNIQLHNSKSDFIKSSSESLYNLRLAYPSSYFNSFLISYFNPEINLPIVLP